MGLNHLKLRKEFRMETKKTCYIHGTKQFTPDYVIWLEEVVMSKFSAEKVKEAYTDAFGDTLFDFDIENYE